MNRLWFLFALALSCAGPRVAAPIAPAGPHVAAKAAPQTPLYGTAHLDFARWGRDPATCCSAQGKTIAIASGGPLSSAAGLAAFRQGGNIVDAAVAVAFALNVERDASTSLSGGGFATLHLAGHDYFLDFRETAPRLAVAALYLDAAGKPIPRKTLDGALATATPGMVAGLWALHQRFGKLPWPSVVAPAVRLAREGFPVYVSLHDRIESRRTLLAADPYTRSLLFDKGGAPLAVGAPFVQRDLADTLDAIAQGGKDAFYRGPIARRIADFMAKKGGVLDLSDLAAYEARWREPLRGRVGELEIVTAPPPSAGGVGLLEVAGLLAPFDLAQLARSDAAAYLHLLAEAMKRAYADRAELIGDPDALGERAHAYERLVTPAYWDGARKKLDRARATPASQVRPAANGGGHGHGTTSLSIIDGEGNAISCTITLNIGNFGAGLAVPGTGIFLNNEMDDFTLVPGQPNIFGLVGSDFNALAPGRRPVSSMAPSVLLAEGRPVLAFGAAGGSKIPTALIDVLFDYLYVFRADLRSAVFAPRLHQQWLPDVVDLELGFDPALTAALTARGNLVTMSHFGADVEAVALDPATGVHTAVFDPRNQGGAAAE
jgi:gamma-glutamyltranspeptidase/glutathione hydrolase